MGFPPRFILLRLGRTGVALEKRIGEGFREQVPALAANDYQAPGIDLSVIGCGAGGGQELLDLFGIGTGVAEPLGRHVLAGMNQRQRGIEHFLVIGRTHAGEYIAFPGPARTRRELYTALCCSTSDVQPRQETPPGIDIENHFDHTKNMEMTSASERLAALGHETRLAIFRLLVQSGAEGVNAGLIGEKLEIPGPTLSFHLAHLTRVGLIKAKQESRFIFYAADYGTMDELLAFLTENCCQGGQCLPKTAAVALPKKGARSARRSP